MQTFLVQTAIKKTVFNTASKRRGKTWPFFPRKLYKNYKKKRKEKEKEKNKQTRNSQVIVIACLQHTEQFAPSSLYEAFFHSRQHRKHTLFIFLLYGCVELIFFFFFFLCSMLKAEKQAIICTLYTQHTHLQPSLPHTHTPVCTVPGLQEGEGSASTSSK